MPTLSPVLPRCTTVSRLVLPALLGLLICAPAAAQTQQQPSLPPTTLEPLGIAMEGWPYPYPVRFHEFTLEGQTVRQAFMDVAPTGPANGRTALLLHGRNFPASYWETVIRKLSGAGWRVIATDQIGFGRSSKPDVHFTFDMYARNTAALLDSLNIGQVDVVGHSLGGMLAVRFTPPTRRACAGWCWRRPSASRTTARPCRP